MLGTLLLGWILTWFHLDTTIVDGLNQIFHTDFNTAVYWIIFFVLGLIVGLFGKKDS